MNQEDRIIVLNVTPLGEKSAVLHTLSQKWGRRAFIVRDKAKSGSFLQPLNILDVVVMENPKSSLWAVSLFRAVMPLAGIRQSFGKNAISMFIAEVFFRSLREGMADPALFQWACREIALLDALERDYSNFHIVFLLDYAAALGFAAEYDDLLPFLEDDASDAKYFFMGTQTALLTPLSGARRTKLCHHILKYLESHLEISLNVRSLGVLAELFS